jgi:hypothetical protein
LLLEFLLIVLHFIVDDLQIILQSFKERAPISITNLLPTFIDSKIVYQLLQIVGLVVLCLDFFHVGSDLFDDVSHLAISIACRLHRQVGVVDAILAHLLWLNIELRQLVGKSLNHVEVLRLRDVIAIDFIIGKCQEIEQLILCDVVILQIKSFCHVKEIFTLNSFFCIIKQLLKLLQLSCRNDKTLFEIRFSDGLYQGHSVPWFSHLV